MVRMSKAKQDKLESIMHLVEQLGIDRVLGRLRQTKMMSKDVLDDMKEWETDYEKRVALLGFLVSPEGKRAFGALYELSKVHEEQLRLQEEQEKLRQEQLAQQSQSTDLRKYGARGKGGAATANMKLKLRAQLAKRREPQAAATTKQDAQPLPSQSQAQQITVPAPATSKSGKRNSLTITAKKPPVKEQSKENGEDDTKTKPDEPTKAKEKAPKTPSPIQGISSRVRKTSDLQQQPGQDNGLDLSLTGCPAAIQISVLQVQSTKISPAVSPVAQHPESPEAPKTPDIVVSKTEDTTDGRWGTETSNDAEASEEDTGQDMHIEEDRPPPDGQNEEDDKDGLDEATSSDGTPIKKVRISDSVTVVEVRDSAPTSPSTAASTPVIRRRRLHDIHQKLLIGDITVDKLTMDQIKEIVAEWQIMKKDHGDDGDYLYKELQHVKDDLKKMTEEKEKIRKEKDRYVFKEFELQQKLDGLTQKHKSLKEDYESLKQGNYQFQQNTKKNNKIHQEMRKKIAKLESKIKSMDKVTLRKGTQTTEVFDKDVHEALRIAEESLQVTLSELKEAVTKSKAAQQEAEDLKKQLNAKGREINKRERKSKKDEESIRFITRERDTLETKLRKVTEQLEYYKGMIEIRTKGGKRQVPEKKEVRVQRCSSGRHVLLKTHVAAGCHQKDEDSKNSGRGDGDESKSGSNRNGRNSLTNGNSVRQVKQTTKPSQQTSKQPTIEQTTQNKSTKSSNGSSSSNATKTAPNIGANVSSSSSTKASTSTTVTTAKTTPNVTSNATHSIKTNATSNGAKTVATAAPKTPNTDSKVSQNKGLQKQQSNEEKETTKVVVGSESPTLASRRPPQTPNEQKQQTGNESPMSVKKQLPSKSDEKPVRPKAATVRQTTPASNAQRK